MSIVSLTAQNIICINKIVVINEASLLHRRNGSLVLYESRIEVAAVTG